MSLLDSLDGLDSAVWTIDAETNALRVSTGYRSLLGYSEEAELRDPGLLETAVHPADLPLFREQMGRLEQGVSGTIEYRIVLCNGDVKWVQQAGIVLFDRERRPACIQGIVQDITECKAKIHRLDSKVAMLEKLLRSVDVALWSLDQPSGEFTFISQAMPSISGYPASRFTNAQSWFDIVHEDDLPLIGRLKESAKLGLPDFCEYRIRHLGGEIRWVHTRVMPQMDEQGGTVQIDGVTMDVTARKVAEEERHRSEQKYKCMFENNSDIICELDALGNVLTINPACEATTGERVTGDLAHFAMEEVLGPDNLHVLTEYFDRALQGQSIPFEITSRHQNGSEFCWEVKYIPIYLNGKIEGAFVVFRNMTDRKRIEQELADREEQYRSLIELSPQPMIAHRDGTYLYMNAAGFRLLGASPGSEEAVHSIYAIVHPDDREAVLERARRTEGSKFAGVMEYRIMRVDGGIVEVEATEIYDAYTRTTLTLFTDITGRRQMERALRESDERYRRLVELSPVAIAVYKDGKISYINPAGAGMLGVEMAQFKEKEEMLDWVHSDSREAALRRMEDTEQHGYAPPGEFRIIRKDGCVLDISVVSIFDPESSTIQLMFEDITARKRTERALVESEERHIRLQTSLDRFSHDLFGVMKISQMERRLIKEVRDVLQAQDVSLVETEPASGGLCQIIETEYGYSLKIGEIRSKSYVLRIEGKPAMLNIAAKRIWLETIARYVSVLFDNFLLIEDLTKELEQTTAQQVAPTWLLRLLFNLSENERKRLSQDLHDAALQEQIIWYRKVDALASQYAMPGELRAQLEQIAQGLLDVIYQIRLTCNELRPPMLKEEGLISSLEELCDTTQLRTNYRIVFDSARYSHQLDDDSLISLYRIVQELLANATKHSGASEVRISLSSYPGRIQLEYEDNGVGMDLSEMGDSFKSMGIYGMKERVRSMNGTIQFHSSPNRGLSIYISVPALQTTTVS